MRKSLLKIGGRRSKPKAVYDGTDQTGEGGGFWLRTGSVGLFEDKKRCRLTEAGRCILCDVGERKN